MTEGSRGERGRGDGLRIPAHRPWPAWPFWVICGIIGGSYLALILGMILADLQYVSWERFSGMFADEDIMFSIRLTLISCAISTLLALWVAVPTAYMFSRWRPVSRAGRFFRSFLDALFDVPILLPPLVIGLSLLIFFRLYGQWFEREILTFTYEVAGLILAQFTVACAFAVRAMRATFDHLSSRPEEVARTLGASRNQAFWMITLPSCKRGVVTAGTIAWARSMGEFGPVLVFAGATRMKTEVLPTTVYLELAVGNLRTAVAVSLLMIGIGLVLMIMVRLLGERGHAHDRL